MAVELGAKTSSREWIFTPTHHYYHYLQHTASIIIEDTSEEPETDAETDWM